MVALVVMFFSDCRTSCTHLSGAQEMQGKIAEWTNELVNEQINKCKNVWTVNFEICFDVQLTKRQPPIPKASQAAAWSHRYIGYWMGKTEGSPIGFVTIFWGLKSWRIPLAKVVHFEPLGALFGAGAPDPDLARLGFSIEFMHAKWNALDTHTQPLSKMKQHSRNPYNYLLKWTEVHQTIIITCSNEPKFTRMLIFH